ncbi:OmpA family protein [Prosthecobacter sp. SYSU 5D2]|uniref:OmpA family protein n=1 Tax=Prosthecobacter sp. SYSU 5D2 TaxID=3134134 RepID=UPI0031FE55D2
MRFFILLISLALLLLLVIVHGWFYTEKQLPDLHQQVLAALAKQGVRSAAADVRFLDLRIAGNAPDRAALEKARAAVLAIRPLRLVKDELSIPASLRARLANDILTLEGWLPEEQNIREAARLIHLLRPDLTVTTEGLHADAQVRWPESEQGPLTADSRLMAPIIENLKVAAWLEMVKDSSGIKLAGLVPANGLRGQLVKLLSGTDATELKESAHTLPSVFSDTDSLTSFVRAFFTSPSARRFSINKEGEPMIEAAATRTLESEWLALLRPVTGGKKVISKLVFYPSEYHFPGYKPESTIPETQLENLRETLSGQSISFDPGRQTLSAQEQAKLAALTPSLLTAGPVVKLLIGSHPDPDGNPESERKLALARAGEVHSFLVEQGLPASDVQTAAFEPVRAGTPGAPENPRTVEILIR